METILDVSLTQDADHIIEEILKCKEVKYTFLKRVGLIEYQFKVESDMEEEKLVMYTKMLIGKTRYGRLSASCVLIDGQIYEGDPGRSFKKHREYKPK